MEFITELEKKLDTLIETIDRIRLENDSIKKELEEKSRKIAEVEDENRILQSELNTLKSSSQEHQNKLRAASEKVQGLIAKLNAV